jgi:Holliday junction resolvasome RuvABC endonuclease subunit
MRVLGLDPSLTGTGIAYPDGSTAVVTTKPCGDTLAARHQRLDYIVSAALSAAHHVDVAVIESPSLGQARQGGTLDRNGLWWLIVHYLTGNEVQVVDVAPATLKKYATGKGNATKPDMRMALFQRFARDVRDDNEADALWLRALGMHLAGQPLVDLPQVNLSALAKVAWPRPASVVA